LKRRDEIPLDRLSLSVGVRLLARRTTGGEVGFLPAPRHARRQWKVLPTMSLRGPTTGPQARRRESCWGMRERNVRAKSSVTEKGGNDCPGLWKGPAVGILGVVT